MTLITKLPNPEGRWSLAQSFPLLSQFWILILRIPITPRKGEISRKVNFERGNFFDVSEEQNPQIRDQDEQWITLKKLHGTSFNFTTYTDNSWKTSLIKEGCIKDWIAGILSYLMSASDMAVQISLNQQMGTKLTSVCVISFVQLAGRSTLYGSYVIGFKSAKYLGEKEGTMM